MHSILKEGPVITSVWHTLQWVRPARTDGLHHPLRTASPAVVLNGTFFPLQDHLKPLVKLSGWIRRTGVRWTGAVSWFWSRRNLRIFQYADCSRRRLGHSGGLASV